jgi:drug/metabolite transporter (DMT)-like permease
MISLWAALVCVAIVAFTGLDLYLKRLSSTHDGTEIGYLMNLHTALYAFPVAIILLWFSDFQEVTPVVAVGLALAVLLNAVGIVLFMGALEREDISVVSPLGGLKPVFVAIAEPVLFRTGFDPILIAASLFAFFGGYIVLLDGPNLKKPLERLRDEGPRLALASTVVYAGLALTDRYMTSVLNPLAYGGIIALGVALALGYRLYKRHSQTAFNARIIFSRQFLPLGPVRFVGLGAILFAFPLASATQTIIAMQAIPVLTVLVSGFALRESGLVQRGAGVMCIAFAVGVTAL